MSPCSHRDNNQEVQDLATSVAMQQVYHDLTSGQGKIRLSTLSHAECNVGEPHHVGSTLAPYH